MLDWLKIPWYSYGELEEPSHWHPIVPVQSPWPWGFALPAHRALTLWTGLHRLAGMHPCGLLPFGTPSVKEDNYLCFSHVDPSTLRCSATVFLTVGTITFSISWEVKIGNFCFLKWKILQWVQGESRLNIAVQIWTFMSELNKQKGSTVRGSKEALLGSKHLIQVGWNTQRERSLFGDYKGIYSY